jgi:peptidoglycan/LPS O-acetylase OafA/YrhL
MSAKGIVLLFVGLFFYILYFYIQEIDYASPLVVASFLLGLAFQLWGAYICIINKRQHLAYLSFVIFGPFCILIYLFIPNLKNKEENSGNQGRKDAK